MKMYVYSLHDSKAGAFLRPFYAPSKGLALRAVLAALEDPNHDLAKYPGDFTLFELGEWEDTTAVYTPHEAKQSLGTMLELGNRTESRRTISEPSLQIAQTEGEDNHAARQ